MQITAAMVKELRERTGSGMMECKKALQEANGDIDTAIENMRKSGLAKADKKAGRVAAEGRIAIRISEDGKTAVILEVNCETDFVSGGDDFAGFVNEVAAVALENRPETVDALVELPIDADQSVEDKRKALVSKIGENIQVRRFEIMSADAGTFGSYLHGTRIGVLLAVANGNDELIKDVAMHIAASRPAFVTEDQVPSELLDKEREILIAQAQDSGKPQEIIEKMVDGRIRKYLAEITLVGQPFVKDPDKTVGALLKDEGANVTGFVRYEVGEGIEKKKENFADEVMAQVKAS